MTVGLSFLTPVLVVCGRLSRRNDVVMGIALDREGIRTFNLRGDGFFRKELDAWAAEARSLFRQTELHSLKVSLDSRRSRHVGTLPDAPLAKAATAFQTLEQTLIALHRAHAPRDFSLGLASCSFQDGPESVRFSWNNGHEAFDLPAFRARALSRRFRRALLPWATGVLEIRLHLDVAPPTAHERAALLTRHRRAAS